jgi:hypothetical protein
MRRDFSLGCTSISDGQFRDIMARAEKALRLASSFIVDWYAQPYRLGFFLGIPQWTLSLSVRSRSTQLPEFIDGEGATRNWWEKFTASTSKCQGKKGKVGHYL